MTNASMAVKNSHALTLQRTMPMHLICPSFRRLKILHRLCFLSPWLGNVTVMERWIRRDCKEHDPWVYKVWHLKAEKGASIVIHIECQAPTTSKTLPLLLLRVSTPYLLTIVLYAVIVSWRQPDTKSSVSGEPCK